MSSRPTRATRAPVYYSDAASADGGLDAAPPRASRRLSREAAVSSGAESGAAEGVRYSSRRRRRTERYVDASADADAEADGDGGSDGSADDEDEEEEVVVRKSTRKSSLRRNKNAQMNATEADREYARRLSADLNGTSRTRARLRLRVKPPQPSQDPRDCGVLLQKPPDEPEEPSPNEVDSGAGEVDPIADEDEPEPLPQRELRSRVRKAKSLGVAPYEDGSDYQMEPDDDDEEEEEPDPDPDGQMDHELFDEGPELEEVAGDIDYPEGGGRSSRRNKSRPTRSSRSAPRLRSSGKLTLRSSRIRRSTRERSRQRPWTDEVVEHVDGPRKRKKTARLIDNLGVEPVAMRTTSRERRRDRRKSSSGGDRGRSYTGRKGSRKDNVGFDTDEEMPLDDSDSSDTTDSDEEEAAAAIDFAVTPMAVEGDARSRPSRYVRRRGRSDPIGASGTPSGRKARPEPAGIEPIQVDLNLSWDDVGGLDHHVRALKEMVFLPLLYPEVFEKFKMEPPKGVLFYGPPGTGKTLCARALAASCGAVPVAEDATATAATSPIVAAGEVSGVAPTEPNDGPPVDGPAVKPTDGGTGESVPAESAADATEKALEDATETAADSTGRAATSGADVVNYKIEADIATTPTAPAVAVGGKAESVSIVPTEIPVVEGEVPPSGAIADNETGLVGHISAPGLEGSAGSAKQRPRVAFFMRNGADCLSKWVGEAERQLRMTFEAAKKHQPSIIFFDEIDGLAPVRSARQDQIHSSIVSTLLGLMDGLDGRGQIVVIGATNRVDSVDPALRRPGRFDRELIFTLPNGVARRKILDIHTSHWKPEPPESAVLDAVASKTVGYCGADLRALCSESALRALRRRYPQIYQSNDKLLIDVDQVQVRTRDFVAAMKEIVPASHRSARTHARPIPSRLAPVLETPLAISVNTIKRIFPQGVTPELKAATSMSGDSSANKPADDFDDGDESGWSDDDGSADEAAGIEVDISRAGKERVVHGRGGLGKPVLRPRLLVCGRDGMGQGQIGPALLHYLEGCPVHAIDLPSLFADGGSRSSEEALVTCVREACRAVPSILYLPHLGVWWTAAHETLRTTLSIVLRDIPAELPLLILATAGSPLSNLPEEVKEMFADFVEIDMPSECHRIALFAPIVKEAEECPKITDAVVRRRRAKRRAEVLPKAPPPVAKPPTAIELERREADDERCIRQLRMEMREFVDRVRTDRRFAAFRDPVDVNEVTDYFDVIKDPMWIGKIAEQVDKGMYPTVLAMVKDFDQLVANAIKYNPPHKEEGAALLRRAHALVDIVHTWVDKLNPELVERCNAVVLARLRRLHAESTRQEADAAAEATLPLTSLPPSATTAAATTAAAATAQLQPADGMAVDTDTAPVPAKANGILRDGHTGPQGNGPSPTTVVEDDDEGGSGSGDAMADVEEETVPEEPFVPATKRDLADLKDNWLEVTTGMNVEALDTLYTRCSSALYDGRRSRNRRAVVEAIAKIVDDGKSDETLKLVA